MHTMYAGYRGMMWRGLLWIIATRFALLVPIEGILSCIALPARSTSVWLFAIVCLPMAFEIVLPAEGKGAHVALELSTWTRRIDSGI